MLAYLDTLPFFFLLYINIFQSQLDTLHIVCATFSFINFILWTTARIQLGSSFSILPKASRLVRIGLYSKIRHPIYLFSSLALLFLILPSHSIIQYAILLLVILIQLYRARLEEAILAHV